MTTQRLMEGRFPFIFSVLFRNLVDSLFTMSLVEANASQMLLICTAFSLHKTQTCFFRGFCLTDEGFIVNKFQKPLLQLEFLLRVCHQGGWVVDLCCGSGSGVIAALRLGFCAAGLTSGKSKSTPLASASQSLPSKRYVL